MYLAFTTLIDVRTLSVREDILVREPTWTENVGEWHYFEHERLTFHSMQYNTVWK